MILNDGVEDTVCFHTDYRTRTALINELGYVVWKIDFVQLGQIGEDVTSKCLEVRDILNDYFAAEVSFNTVTIKI
jgi:hypothetical protein